MFQFIQFVNGGNKFVITTRVSKSNHYKVSVVDCIDTTTCLVLI